MLFILPQLSLRLERHQDGFTFFFFWVFFYFCHSSEANFKKAQRIYKTSRSPQIYHQIAHELYKSKYYFSATLFARKHITRGQGHSQKFEKLVESLILKTGATSFYDLEERHLRKYKSTSLLFILGLKSFNQKKYRKAQFYLKQIPQAHRFSPESRFIRGSSLNFLNQFKMAQKEYGKCEEIAEKYEKKARKKQLRRYFAIIRETCTIHKARLLFKQRKLPEALEAYEKIPKTSYRWPYILLEKAWTSYSLGDYNRTLGTLVTYKSPLLKDYFLPEVEVLNSLSYFRLCLWKDSLLITDKYYKIYKPRSDALREILIPHKRSSTYFFKTLKYRKPEKGVKNIFINNLKTQIGKKVKYNLDYFHYQKAKNEFRFLKKKVRNEFNIILNQYLMEVLLLRIKLLNHYVKKEMFRFINDINRFSYELLNIKLEILSLKRDFAYEDKKLISHRSRGSLENVRRSSERHFYHFEGAFWADELGEYSFGLKSNCKIKIKEKEKD